MAVDFKDVAWVCLSHYPECGAFIRVIWQEMFSMGRKISKVL